MEIRLLLLSASQLMGPAALAAAETPYLYNCAGFFNTHSSPTILTKQNLVSLWEGY